MYLLMKDEVSEFMMVSFERLLPIHSMYMMQDELDIAEHGTSAYGSVLESERIR